MVASVQFPLDEPVSDVREAVKKLTECSQEELERARKHHRRAVQALRDGGYGALSTRTRERLFERLHHNLEALNTALRTKRNAEENSAQKSPFSPESSTNGFGVPDLVRWLPL